MPRAISNPVEADSNQNQFGGTFGGPIKKDRTFFFASYEGRRVRQGIPSPAVTVPSRGTAQRHPGLCRLLRRQSTFGAETLEQCQAT